MKRRNFLTWLGLGCSISWLTNVLTGCTKATNNSQPSTISETSVTGITSESAVVSQPGGFVKIGTIQDLEQKERIIVEQANKSSLLVIRDPLDSDKLFAVNSRCTHRGCIVDWNSDKQEIVCPCHGSTFKPDGQVLKGLASRPLERFETKIEGNDILVKIQI